MTTQIKKQLAFQKQSSPLNKSTSKMQYSFGKAKRFNEPKRIFTEVSCYDLPTQLSKRSTGFGFGHRSNLSQDNGCPSPTKYNASIDKLVSYPGGLFANGRDQVIFGSMIKPNQNPPPNIYNPEEKKSRIAFSIGNLKRQENYQKQSPGPIYNIPSTLNDNNKVLSKYVRKNSTRIVKPIYKSKKDIINPQTPSPHSYHLSIMTKNGSKQFGNGQKVFMTTQKRLKSSIDNHPGPGNYKSFSEFIEQSKTIQK